MAEHNHTTRKPTPGSMALIVMGWLELVVSIVTFLIGLYAIAITFAVAALLLSLVASQVRPPAWQTGSRPSEPAPREEVTRMSRTMFLITAVLGWGLLGGAIFFLIRQTYLPAIAMGLWAISLGIQAIRLRNR